MEYKGILLIGILAFLLYHLLGSCNCNDGFSVGFGTCPDLKRWNTKLIDEIDNCYSYKKCEFKKGWWNTCDSFTGIAKCSDVSNSNIWTDSTLSNDNREEICTKYGTTNDINCKAKGISGPIQLDCVEVSQ